MIHLTMNQLSAYLDGQLRESSSELVRRHLDMCGECTGQYAALSKQEAILVRVLTRDAGEEFLGRLERTVGVASPPAVKTQAVASAPPVAEPERGGAPPPPRARPARAERPTREERRAKAERAKRRDAPAPPAKPKAAEREAPTAAPKPPPLVRGWKPFVPTPAPAAPTPAAAETATHQVERAPAPAPAPMPVERAAAPAAPAAKPAVPARRHRQPARDRHQPAVPWFFAVILAVIVGAIGYALPRFDRLALVRDGAPTPPRAATTAEPEAPATTREARSTAPEARHTSPPPVRAKATLEPAGLEPAGLEPAALEPTAAGEEPVAATEGRDLSGSVEEPAEPPVTEAAPDVAREPAPPPPAITRRPVEQSPGVTAPAPSGPTPRERTDPAARQPATTGSGLLGGRPSVAEARPDPFASVPPAARPFITEARRAARAAAVDSSAAKLDAAGDAWERAITVLDPAHRLPAQRSLAEARFQAWLTEPNGYRAAAATAALRTYLVFAPQGSGRDLARALLARVQRG